MTKKPRRPEPAKPEPASVEDVRAADAEDVASDLDRIDVDADDLYEELHAIRMTLVRLCDLVEEIWAEPVRRARRLTEERQAQLARQRTVVSPQPPIPGTLGTPRGLRR